MNTGALLPERGAGTSLTTVAARAGDRSSCSWRAGCGEIRKSGSEGSGEETTGRKAGIGASPLTLRGGRQIVASGAALVVHAPAVAGRARWAGYALRGLLFDSALSPSVAPGVHPVPQTRQGQGTHRVAVTHDDPQPHQALQPPNGRSGGLKRPPPGDNALHSGHVTNGAPTTPRPPATTQTFKKQPRLQRAVSSLPRIDRCSSDLSPVGLLLYVLRGTPRG